MSLTDVRFEYTLVAVPFSVPSGSFGDINPARVQNRFFLPVVNKLRAFGGTTYVAPVGVFSPWLSQRYAIHSVEYGPPTGSASQGDEIFLPVQNSLA